MSKSEGLMDQYCVKCEGVAKVVGIPGALYAICYECGYKRELDDGYIIQAE